MKASKDIESHLIKLMNGERLEDTDVYTATALAMIDILGSIGIDSFQGVHKPRTAGRKPVYGGRGSEPKTDVCFVSNQVKHRLSIKMDSSAYIVSCNSPEDFIKMFVTLFGGDQTLDTDTIGTLHEAAARIGKVANFHSFDKAYKGDATAFVCDKFLPKASRYVGVEKAREIGEYIIGCYNDPEMKAQYVKTLHESESFLQEAVKSLFVK